MTMMVPVGEHQIRTHSLLSLTLEQPPGPWLYPTSSLFHILMTSHSLSMVDQLLAAQEVNTVGAVVQIVARTRVGNLEAVAARMKSEATELPASARWLPPVNEVSAALSATAVPTPTL